MQKQLDLFPDLHPVAKILANAAHTFEERNILYGDNYLKFGAVMAAIFPDGMAIESEADFARFGLFIQCVSKLTRYAASPEGHQDSAHDLAVYAAMLESLTP